MVFHKQTLKTCKVITFTRKQNYLKQSYELKGKEKKSIGFIIPNCKECTDIDGMNGLYFVYVKSKLSD